MEIVSAKLTVGSQPSGWAQVYEFTPEDAGRLKARGRLYAIISQGGQNTSEQIESITQAREIISKLHDEYFNSESSKPFNALKQVVEKVSSEFGLSIPNLEIAVCSIVDGTAFCACYGGGEIVIYREGALATILQSQKDTPSIMASGYPKVNDQILMATSSFFTSIPRELIKSALTTGDPSMAAEILAPEVRRLEMGNIGALVLKFEDTSPIKTLNSPEIALPVEAPVAGTQNPAVPTVNIQQKLSNFLQKIQKGLPERKIYVRSASEEEAVSYNKKLTFSVGIILLILLAVSIGFGIQQKKVRDTRNKYQNVLVNVAQSLEEAISLASISPEKSRELFIESEQKLKEIEDLGKNDPKVAELKAKIEESRASILGEYLGETKLFLDLSLLSSGFKGDALATSGDSVFILDTSGKRIVSIVLENKKSKVVAGPDIVSDAKEIAAYDDRVFVESGDGIYEIGRDKKKVIEKEWEGDVFITAFAGNLYVLDKASNLIYRYSGGEGSTFGSKQNWLSSSTQADFGNALSWGIDGAVYVLFPNSRILKYSLGSPQVFRVSGVIPEIGSIDALSAAEGNEYIYLLDSAGKRVVVTDKKGEYKAQYVAPEIKDATNLVVSEAQKKIILLIGDKLYEINVSHLGN